MPMKYISAWEIFRHNFSQILHEALTAGLIEYNDVIWRGPSGDAVVASDPAALNDYADYTDAGTVAEYLMDTDSDLLISLTEAAAIVPLAYSTLAQAAREGRIMVRRSGATWLTTRFAIQAAIDSGKLRPRE